MFDFPFVDLVPQATRHIRLQDCASRGWRRYFYDTWSEKLSCFELGIVARWLTLISSVLTGIEPQAHFIVTYQTLRSGKLSRIDHQGSVLHSFISMTLTQFVGIVEYRGGEGIDVGN